MTEPIDDLLKQIPDGWDFWIGSSWNSEGKVICTARLSQRAEGEYLHRGHYIEEIEREASSLREALRLAVEEAAGQ